MWDYDSRLIAEEDWADFESRLEPWEIELIYAPPTQEELDRIEPIEDEEIPF
jgi:hypothetical protein